MSADLYCIKTHSQKAVIRGNIYPLLGENKPCGCKGTIDVGVRGSVPPGIPIGTLVSCPACNNTYPFDGIWWVAEKLFVNLDDIDVTALIEETELVEK